WPEVLQDAAYEAECKKIERLLPEAVKQGGYGPVPAKTVTELKAAINALLAKLKANIAQIDSVNYIRAKRYLNELADSIKVLQSPNAAKYVSGQWSAHGDTVAQLVSNMARQGLRFGPATAGDQEAYTALHRAMVTYDQGVRQLVARQQ